MSSAAPELFVEASEPLGDRELPRCAIVILNWNGRHHLERCLESIRGLRYPADLREVVLVDNGSSDGSVELLRARFPWVRLRVNERNVGFSAGCNQGARAAADADVLVFLNNDIRVEPDFLRELVAPIVRGACDATSARILSWDGERVNSAGGGMNFHGIGIQRAYLDEPGPEHERPCWTLFGCGGAMAMGAQAFRDVGGFEEEFFAYYEDVDLGWRTWILGKRVQYAPRAVCYHHHSSTSSRVPRERLRLLQVRNPLLACFKNYADDNLRRVFPAMLALALRRAILRLELGDRRDFRIEELSRLRRPGRLARTLERLRGRAEGRRAVARAGLADLVGIDDLLGSWDHWARKRAAVQRARERPDDEILHLFLRPLWCIEDEPGYKELHRGATAFFGIDALFDGLTSMPDDPRQA